MTHQFYLLRLIQLIHKNVDFNHQNVDLDIRFGTDPQAKMSKVSGSASLFNVGVKVENGSPITRQLTNNSDLDAVKVTVTVPILQVIEEDGDVVGSSVTFDIQLQYNGGGFTTVHSDTIRGRQQMLITENIELNLLVLIL